MKINKKVKEDEIQVKRNRFSTYYEALLLFDRAVEAHLQVSRIYNKIDKLFDGFPPYNPENLKKLGQGHVVNADFGDAREKEQKGTQGYYSIFFKSKFLADITVKNTPELRAKFEIKKEKVEDSILQGWSNIITEEWTRMMREDLERQFLSMVSVHSKYNLRYGTSTFYWPKSDDFLPEIASPYAHYKTDDSSVDTNENDKEIIRHTMKFCELLDIWESNPKAWNRKAVREVIEHLLLQHEESNTNSDDDRLGNIFERYIQDKRRYNELYAKYENLTVQVAKIYVKEFNINGAGDGVSLIIITPGIQTQEPLYFKDRAYKEMTDVILTSHLLPGIVSIKDAKGLGHISHGGLSEVNKLQCAFATNIKLDGTTFFKSNTGSIADLRKVTIPVGGVAMVPQDFATLSTTASNSSNATLAGINYIESLVNKNASFLITPPTNNEQAVSVQRQNQRTYLEFQQVNIAHYFSSTLNPLYKILFRKQLEFKDKQNRNSKIFKNFIKRVVAKGVPEHLFTYQKSETDEITGLPTWFRVSAYKATSTGSQVGDIQRIEDAFAFGIPQQLKTRGRDYFQEMTISSVFGQEYVDKLIPKEDRANDPTYMDTIITAVLNDVEQGLIAEWSPDLNHATIVEKGIERMGKVLEYYFETRRELARIPELPKDQARELIFEVDNKLQALGNFVAMSLTILAEDPLNKELYQGMLPIFQRIEGIAQGIHANAGRAMDAAQREQGQMAQEQSNEGKRIELHHAREMKKIELENRRKGFEAGASFNLNLIKERQKAITDKMKADNSVMIKLQEARAKLQMMEEADKRGLAE